MRLSAFIALCAGMAIELLMLWEGARQRSSQSTRPHFLGPLHSLEQGLIALVLLLSLALIAILELAGLSPHVYMGGPVIDSIFVCVGLLLLYFGLVDPRLLPRVNEQAVLVVHTTIILTLVLNSAALDPRLALALRTGQQPAWPVGLPAARTGQQFQVAIRPGRGPARRNTQAARVDQDRQPHHHRAGQHHADV